LIALTPEASTQVEALERFYIPAKADGMEVGRHSDAGGRSAMLTL
jgi:hypothetical protein